ncbi:disease resistance protein RGA2-like [Ziziphus jujuba]|uniref:Disease resistance protein RGA2-like n=1 Tax=Ziziphus jujuba TaxID=326968 RepID=A0ABM4A001_ZIZJJ|nr:disease resistance protein RGA2-like [Ziziphus jujuba]
MAESILFNIAEGIIGRLGSAAVREIGLLWGVNDELSGLEDTILTIKPILLDAEEKKVNNHQVKIWLSRLEDVVYEADDSLSEVSDEALRRQVVAGHEVALQLCTFSQPQTNLPLGTRWLTK